jgi:hypothetical protein
MVICLLAACVLAAWIDPAHREPGLVSTVGIVSAIASGPIFGWWTAYSRNAMPSALPLLGALTLLSMGPVIVSRFRPSRWLVALAVGFWLFSGYYFATGMWI